MALSSPPPSAEHEEEWKGAIERVERDLVGEWLGPQIQEFPIDGLGGGRWVFIIFIFSFGNWGYLFRKVWGSLMQKAGVGCWGTG